MDVGEEGIVFQYVGDSGQVEIVFDEYSGNCKFCGTKYTRNSVNKWYICYYGKKYIYCGECGYKGKEMQICSSHDCHHPVIMNGMSEKQYEETKARKEAKKIKK